MFFRHPLSDVKKSIKGIGHPKHPFLDCSYSPNSSIPCTDFSPWVIEWIQNNDYKKITLLMQEFMFDRGAQAIVKTIQKANIQNEIQSTKAFIDEFKAMLILFGKQSDWPDFRKAHFYSDALFVHEFTFRPEFHETILKRLRSFRRKEKITYELYPKINADVFKASNFRPNKNPLISWMLTLPLASRLHFINTIKWSRNRKTPLINIANSTDYSIREFGINIAESTTLLSQSPVYSTATSFGDFGREVSKDQLCELLSKASVEYKKSMSKDRLVELADTCPSLKPTLDSLSKKEAMLKFNPAYQTHIDELMNHHERMKPLCHCLAIM